MPPIFGAASRAAVTRMTCPFCGEIQARARGPEGTRYACRKCGRSFTDVEGKREEAPAPARPKKA